MTRIIDKKEYCKGQKYEQFFFESPAVMISFNSDNGDIVDINQAAIDYYGYSTDEFLSMKISDINIAEQSFIFECIRDIKMWGKRIFHFKHRLRNGEVRDVEVFSGVITFEGQNLINSIIVDVTLKLRIEKDLEISRERLAQVIEATRAGIWEYNIIDKTNYIDKQWKAIIGYEDQELSSVSEECQSRLHPEDIPRINHAIQQCEEHKSSHYDVEHRLRHKDGTYRWVKATGIVIYNEKKEPIRTVGAIIDITRIKETEERILESENKLKDFAQAIPDVSAIVDEDGRYIEVFGINADKSMKGQTFHQRFPKELADSMLEDIRQAILTGETRSMIRELDMGSVKRYFEGRTAPMNYRLNGKRTAALVVSDITERLQVDQMLKFTYELQRKSDFINDILSGNLAYNDITITMDKDFKMDLSLPLYCCLIRIDEANEILKLNYPQNQKNKIIHAISTRTSYIVWDNKDRIGVLCETGDTHDTWEQSMKVASEIKKIISDFNPDLVVSIGISDTHSGSGSIEKSYQEAWNTLISAQCQDQDDGRIYHYRDMGIFQILASIYGKEYTSDFVQKMIGPLVAYDSKKGTDFLITLEEVLKNSNLKDSANKLFIHQKTLVFRKQRIEKILGVSLDNFDTRLSISAAIKLHKLNNIKRS
ncbi:PAS domain S-box protein [Desulfosporosinus fructosivorans]|uniref:histidine kinase n=1 Tax=Desulfosporosinus fructosivorans TaxID=2018669 RepID=A0A4Z0R7F6_9FIRM|nr:PAS domain S-box protein [Desulfosporosinus fructosivorans]TGE39032.1 PAS domain S-box protein [Desulfosporosinus fructosivorans]